MPQSVVTTPIIPVGVVGVAASYSPDSIRYDYAIGELPFLSLTSDSTPYERALAPVRKQQVIAVYTIAKDEAQFVERWQRSACGADSLHILDAGSRDQTVTVARDLGIDIPRTTPRNNHARVDIPLDYAGSRDS